MIRKRQPLQHHGAPSCMPKCLLGIMNIGETFQRAMDIALADEKDKFIVIYLDDITIYSVSDQEHLKHLRRDFQKYRKFGISLNAKNSNFGMEEGKFLGNIISKEGIRIYPSRVEGILKIGTPRSNKEVQSFLGKVNFLRRFIPNLTEIIKHITNMIRKGSEIKWNPKARKSFEDIKLELTKAAVLSSPILQNTLYHFRLPRSTPLLVFYYKNMNKILRGL
jgi:hypothetical protein